MNLRDYERDSIRRFVQSAADEGYLSGRVLDYGCGKQPYRDIVEAAGGEYIGLDREHWPANASGEDVGSELTFGVHYDTLLSTQVLQYVPDVPDYLANLRTYLIPQGQLVATYPTNWPEVEEEDLHRFTKAGMERLLTEAGFTIIRHEKRGSVWDPRFDTAPQKRVTATGEEFVLGYGVIARA